MQKKVLKTATNCLKLKKRCMIEQKKLSNNSKKCLKTKKKQKKFYKLPEGENK